MRNKITFFIILFCSSLFAQVTKIDPARLVKPAGTANRMLITNGSSVTAWGQAADLLVAGTGIGISGNTISNTGVTGTGTATRVAFWSGSSTLSSNANLFWDNTNGRLGLGTTTPSWLLDVAGGDARINGVRIGIGAGAVNTNIVVGSLGLNSNTSGSYNIAIGTEALRNNISGGANVAIGPFALYTATSTSGLVAIGINALLNCTGTFNVGIGYDAGRYLTTGTQNLAIGYGALNLETDGNQNFALGAFALGVQNHASYNTAIGASAGAGITTGTRNTVIGSLALQSVTTQQENIAIGFGAARFATGSANTAIGGVLTNTTGSNNVAIQGFGALTSGANSVGIGLQAGATATTGTENVIIGYRAYWLGNGSNNIALGHYAGSHETGSNRLIISPFSYGSESNNRNGAIIYGVMNATAASQRLTFNAKVGLFNQAPSSYLHLPAGSTAASSSPLKLTSGSLMTTAEVGALEFLTDRLYFTKTTGSTRETVAFLSDFNTYFTQGGNSFGTAAILGTNDAHGISIETNNTQRAFFDTNGRFRLIPVASDPASPTTGDTWLNDTDDRAVHHFTNNTRRVRYVDDDTRPTTLVYREDFLKTNNVPALWLYMGDASTLTATSYTYGYGGFAVSVDQTGPSTNGYANLYQDADLLPTTGTYTYTMSCKIDLTSNPNTTNTGNIWIGIGGGNNTSASDPDDFVGFRVNPNDGSSAKYSFVVRKNGTSTSSSGGAIATGLRDLKIVWTSTSVSFYENDVLLLNQTTMTNSPHGETGMKMMVKATSAVSANYPIAAVVASAIMKIDNP